MVLSLLSNTLAFHTIKGFFSQVYFPHVLLLNKNNLDEICKGKYDGLAGLFADLMCKAIVIALWTNFAVVTDVAGVFIGANPILLLLLLLFMFM